MSAPTHDETPTVTLTDDEARRLKNVLMFSHRSALFINVRGWALGIVAARVEALTTDLAATEHMLNLVTVDARAMRQTIANIQALADDWDATASEYAANRGGWRMVRHVEGVTADIRALLPAVPADQGNNHTKDGAEPYPVCSCCDSRLNPDGNCPSKQPCCTRTQEARR